MKTTISFDDAMLFLFIEANVFQWREEWRSHNSILASSFFAYINTYPDQRIIKSRYGGNHIPDYDVSLTFPDIPKLRQDMKDSNVLDLTIEEQRAWAKMWTL